MRKLLFLLAGTIILITFPLLILHADSTEFALVAVSPNGQKSVCVQKNESTLLSALQDYNFNPKQDDTGYVYSIINYDAPLSSNPAASHAFWEFWIKNNSTVTFSTTGIAQTKPKGGVLYYLHFGDGQTTPVTATFDSVCGAPATSQPVFSAPIVQNSPVDLPISTDQTKINLAINYLKSNYSNQSPSDQDWAEMALGAVNQTLPINQRSDSSLTSTARLALAKTAQGMTNVPEITQIKSSYNNGQFGNSNLINTDVFSLLAIESSDPNWISSHQEAFVPITTSQRANGSFGFSSSGNGDTDITAAAIWALVYKDDYPTEAINKALNFLTSARNSDGGYGFEPGEASNIASSSWVSLALKAVNKDTSSIRTYLLSQQQPGGNWLFGGEENYLNSAYALLALADKKMPITKNNISAPISGTPHTPVSSGQPILKKSPIIHQQPNESMTEESTTNTLSTQVICTASSSASASASASGSGASSSSSASATASCQ